MSKVNRFQLCPESWNSSRSGMGGRDCRDNNYSQQARIWVRLIPDEIEGCTWIGSLGYRDWLYQPQDNKDCLLRDSSCTVCHHDGRYYHTPEVIYTLVALNTSHTRTHKHARARAQLE